MSASKRSSVQTPTGDAKRRLSRRRARIVVLALVTALLCALLFVQVAFDILPWLRPSSVSETLSLYVLSTINFLAFVALLMVLVRNIIKLRRERLQKKLGARFKTRLVVFFIALSLLPVTFLFFATTVWINRSIDKWFSLPGDQMLTNAIYMESSYVKGELEGLNRLAVTLTRLVAQTQDEQLAALLATEVDTQRLLLAHLYSKDGHLVAQGSAVDPNGLGTKFRKAIQQARFKAIQGETFNAEVLDDQIKSIYLVSAVPVSAGRSGAFIIAQQVPVNYAESVNQIRKFESRYESLKGERKWLRNTSMQTLALITLLVLFIAFWLALYVARSIADPVQQMAEATERIKRGDLSYRTGVVGDDELAALALSFNEMTAELAENRHRLEQSADDLQQSNAALDERRRYIEAILQSLSAGVISLDENANVTTINEAALRLLRIEGTPVTGVALERLLAEDQREDLRRMILRAARLRSVTREVHFKLANQIELDAAVTVTALQDPRGQSRGAVIVIEDLTELIEAQRRAAWSEVARRMAHEIKNPLTPIRLSAERLAKNLIGDANGKGGSDGLSERQTQIVRECTSMIGAEVATLQLMVDEFSSFARLPNAKIEITSLNEVVENTLKLYDERLNGIRLESNLASALSPVLIDCEQIKRALVNLIDNAAEALADVANERGIDGSKPHITVSTHEIAERETVELIVADSGPGIPPEDREHIFDPYFSTRKRGTGLGLAIVSRIVAEHQGRIRVQDNSPRGARFIVELPTAKTIDS
ncbi:MAG: ATP-binding protein [Acidobacteria bacterium]|nr:ATP-binding protein [Acidobacteriota bacterium]